MKFRRKYLSKSKDKSLLKNTVEEILKLIDVGNSNNFF